MRPGRPIVPVLLLLTVSCADETRAGEIACQQRLVETAGDMGVSRGPGQKGMGAAFARLSKNLHEMELDGCSEDQARSAEILARLSGELAGAAGPAEGALRRPGQRPEDQRAILAFADLFERFEMRRKAAREDLARMKSRGARD